MYEIIYSHQSKTWDLMKDDLTKVAQFTDAISDKDRNEILRVLNGNITKDRREIIREAVKQINQALV